MKHRAEEERGAITLLVAGLASVLLLVTGLVVDLGLARDMRAQSQNAADASVLAAGNVLYDDTSPVADVVGAVAAAQAYAAANLDVTATDWATCSDPDALAHTTSAGQCISFDDETHPTAVRVRVPTRVTDTHFGRLAGVSTVSIAASAEIELDPGRIFECALCVLGDGPHDIGNGDVVVEGSGVHVNGDVGSKAEGSVTADAPITVEGAASGNFFPSVESQAGRMEDPLASMLLPPAGTAELTAKSNPCEDGPGVYGAHSFDSECTLDGGLYVITGVWELKNNANLGGDGVTIFAACGTAGLPRPCDDGGEIGGELAAKNGTLNLVGGAVPGFAVIYDRHNISPVAIQGNGAKKITGSIYAASAKFYANGTTARDFADASIVVDSIDFNGNVELNVTTGVSRTWQRPPGGLHLER